MVDGIQFWIPRIPKQTAQQQRPGHRRCRLPCLRLHKYGWPVQSSCVHFQLTALRHHDHSRPPPIKALRRHIKETTARPVRPAQAPFEPLNETQGTTFLHD
uniref:Uncharacterized protein n=1 Tax=Knipowitschia caucasica TaxID=637954 RepID=A0AAV2LEQ7_KNICA